MGIEVPIDSKGSFLINSMPNQVLSESLRAEPNGHEFRARRGF